jgi:hypothetical protein
MEYVCGFSILSHFTLTCPTMFQRPSANLRSQASAKRRVAKGLSVLEEAFANDVSPEEKKEAYRKFVRTCAGPSPPKPTARDGHDYLVGLCFGFTSDTYLGRWLSRVSVRINSPIAY